MAACYCVGWREEDDGRAGRERESQTGRQCVMEWKNYLSKWRWKETAHSSPPLTVVKKKAKHGSWSPVEKRRQKQMTIYFFIHLS